MNEMERYSQLISHKNGQSGVTAVITGICITALFCIAAIAVDIGYMMVTRNELQNIGDAAALAGVRRLGTIYVGDGYGETGLSSSEQQNYICEATDLANIKLAAKNIAFENWAGSKEDIIINDSDIVIGTWTNNTFTPNLNQPNAVKVTARRDESANGPIATFFAGVLGIDTVPVTASAIAALTSRSTSPPGGYLYRLLYPDVGFWIQTFAVKISSSTRLKRARLAGIVMKSRHVLLQNLIRSLMI